MEKVCWGPAKVDTFIIQNYVLKPTEQEGVYINEYGVEFKIQDGRLTRQIDEEDLERYCDGLKKQAKALYLKSIQI